MGKNGRGAYSSGCVKGSTRSSGSGFCLAGNAKAHRIRGTQVGSRPGDASLVPTKRKGVVSQGRQLHIVNERRWRGSRRFGGQTEKEANTKPEESRDFQVIGMAGELVPRVGV